MHIIPGETTRITLGAQVPALSDVADGTLTGSVILPVVTALALD
jgi:hypothetical protein